MNKKRLREGVFNKTFVLEYQDMMRMEESLNIKDMEKEKLFKTVECLTEEQAKVLNEFLDMISSQFLSKGDIANFVIDKKDSGKWDSATPINYVRAIQDVLPGFNPMFYVYDYRTQTYGEMLNIAEATIKKMNQTFKF